MLEYPSCQVLSLARPVPIAPPQAKIVTDAGLTVNYTGMVFLTGMRIGKSGRSKRSSGL